MTNLLTFTTTHLTPDPQRIIAWIVQEALAWFLSLSPEAAMTTLAIGGFVVLVGLFLVAEQVLTWAVRQ